MTRKQFVLGLAGATLALCLTVPALALVNAGGLAWSVPVGPNANDSIKEAAADASFGTTVTDTNTGGRAQITTTISNAASYIGW